MSGSRATSGSRFSHAMSGSRAMSGGWESEEAQLQRALAESRRSAPRIDHGLNQHDEPGGDAESPQSPRCADVGAADDAYEEEEAKEESVVGRSLQMTAPALVAIAAPATQKAAGEEAGVTAAATVGDCPGVADAANPEGNNGSTGTSVEAMDDDEYEAFFAQFKAARRREAMAAQQAEAVEAGACSPR